MAMVVMYDYESSGVVMYEYSSYVWMCSQNTDCAGLSVLFKDTSIQEL